MDTQYKNLTLDELVEKMKNRSMLGPMQQKELYAAYRLKLQDFIDESRLRHAKILSILGSNYASALSSWECEC